MSDNVIFTITQGSAKTLWFRLGPTDASTGLRTTPDISGWTTTLSVTRGRGATVFIEDAACVPDPDQVTNPAEGTFDFTEILSASLSPGTYELRIKGVDGSGNDTYYPDLPNRAYAVLVVNPQ